MKVLTAAFPWPLTLGLLTRLLDKNEICASEFNHQNWHLRQTASALQDMATEGSNMTKNVGEESPVDAFFILKNSPGHPTV